MVEGDGGDSAFREFPILFASGFVRGGHSSTAHAMSAPGPEWPVQWQVLLELLASGSTRVVGSPDESNFFDFALAARDSFALTLFSHTLALCHCII